MKLFAIRRQILNNFNLTFLLIVRVMQFLLFPLYGSWEALDSSALIVFDVGVFLDTPATHSENFISRHLLAFVANLPPLRG